MLVRTVFAMFRPLAVDLLAAIHGQWINRHEIGLIVDTELAWTLCEQVSQGTGMPGQQSRVKLETGMG